MNDNKEICSGLFYSFATYLDIINKRLSRYDRQPVMFYVDGRGTFVVIDISSNLLNRVVCLEVIDVNNDDGDKDEIALTLTDLLEKINIIKEDCFDFAPVLIKHKEENNNYVPTSENTIPIFGTKVGITEDGKSYAFIVDTIS